MDGEDAEPLHYVDVDDQELEEYPDLAQAVRSGERVPMVLVGNEVKTPAVISMSWIEEQLASLGVAPFAVMVEEKV